VPIFALATAIYLNIILFLNIALPCSLESVLFSPFDYSAEYTNLRAISPVFTFC